MSDLETLTISVGHDQSMSRDPFIAIHGRFNKEVTAALIRWMEAEAKRGSFEDEVIAAAGYGISKMVAAIFLNIPDAERDVVEHFLTTLSDSVRKLVAQTGEEKRAS